MVGFVIGLIEPDHTGHITTVGVSRIICPAAAGEAFDGGSRKGFSAAQRADCAAGSKVAQCCGPETL